MAGLLLRILRVLLILIPVSLVTARLHAQFTAIQSEEGVEIQDHGRKVLFYQSKPKSLSGKYERAGYIHPLYSLNGSVLTEDFPEDHPYHHGIFWTWHQIILRNRLVADGWTSDSISWQVQRVTVKKAYQAITLSSNVVWKVRLTQETQTPVIKENTLITVSTGKNGQRNIDFDIRLFPLVDSLKIGGSDDVKGYGGFCLRLKLPDDIEFISGDSLVTARETAVKAGTTMDFRGSFDGNSLPESGIMLKTTPIDSDLQNSWVLRKKGSMQNIVYPGRLPVLIPRTGLRMRYRIVIH
jgi:hypothetical protein